MSWRSLASARSRLSPIALSAGSMMSTDSAVSAIISAISPTNSAKDGSGAAGVVVLAGF